MCLEIKPKRRARVYCVRRRALVVDTGVALAWRRALVSCIGVAWFGFVRCAQEWPRRCTFSLAPRIAMPFSPQTLGRRLRCSLRHSHLALDLDGHVYLGTCAALGALEAALDEEMPPWAPRKRGRGKTDRAGQSRVLSNKVTYLRCKVQKLRVQLKHALAQQGRRVASAFVCKVALSSLVSPVASFAETLRDLSVMDSVLGER